MNLGVLGAFLLFRPFLKIMFSGCSDLPVFLTNCSSSVESIGMAARLVGLLPDTFLVIFSNFARVIYFFTLSVSMEGPFSATSGKYYESKFRFYHVGFNVSGFCSD